MFEFSYCWDWILICFAQLWYCELCFVWKTNWGEAESIVVLKSDLFSARILTEAMIMTHSDMLYLLDIYIHILFLWAIAVSNFRPLEIYRNFSLLLSTITCTVSSHADNHFCEYIHLFQILYSMKYFLNRFFIFIRTMVYGEKNYWKIIFGYRLCENYWVTYCTHITS